MSIVNKAKSGNSYLYWISAGEGDHPSHLLSRGLLGNWKLNQIVGSTPTGVGNVVELHLDNGKTAVVVLNLPVCAYSEFITGGKIMFPDGQEGFSGAGPSRAQFSSGRPSRFRTGAGRARFDTGMGRASRFDTGMGRASRFDASLPPHLQHGTFGDVSEIHPELLSELPCNRVVELGEPGCDLDNFMHPLRQVCDTADVDWSQRMIDNPFLTGDSCETIPVNTTPIAPAMSPGALVTTYYAGKQFDMVAETPHDEKAQIKAVYYLSK